MLLSGELARLMRGDFGEAVHTTIHRETHRPNRRPQGENCRRYMNTFLEFRVWLKQRRYECGFTQEELGELVGYAGQTIRKIESGQRRPSPQLAVKLAQILQIAPEEQAAWSAAARMARLVAAPEEHPPAAEPLRALPPATLPTYLTPFVGREQEQSEIAALLARPDCRLVTLLGPGGVGKTRLAIETARTVQGFTDGTAFVSLAPVAAPTSIVPAIGDAIGFAFASTGDLTAQLLAYLHDRRILLILDNLEHLLDRAEVTLGFLTRLLAEAPNISVLATSRERLRLTGEWVVELAGLAVGQPQFAARPAAGPALTLFVEHIERVDRAFRLTPENAGTIAAICRQVDGLPLGIELAAAWTRLLSLEEITRELTRSLDTAHLSPGALPARHYSLRAVVDHSWQLLNAAERAALRRLAVFRGGFTREAAEQVAEAGLGVLANLADKSLLRRGANGRYDLHEIIRQYADMRLEEQVAERDGTRDRHAAYYLRFVAEREHRLKGAEQAGATGELTAEIDNIRAAWHWAIGRRPLDELERAGEVLQWFYEFRSWLQEGAVLFAETVERLRAVGAFTGDEAQRRLFGRLLGHYGYLAARLGMLAEATTVLAESYALLADEGDPTGLGRTLNYQASAALWSGDYATARRQIDRSLELTARTGDSHVTAMNLTLACSVAHALGAYEEAEQLFRAALAHWRTLGNPRGTVWCITFGCNTLLLLGAHQEAQQLLHESLKLSHATDDRYGTATTLHQLGRIAAQQGDVEEAIYFFREALPLLPSTWNWLYAQALNDLAAALWQVGAQQETWRTYRTALAAALQVQSLYETLRALIGLAVYQAHAGRHAAALALAVRVLAEPAGPDDVRRSAEDLRRTACAHLTPEEVAQIAERARTQALVQVLAGLPAGAP